MILPGWVQKAIQDLTPPSTGKVVLELELYQGGVTRIELGGVMRFKPSNSESKITVDSPDWLRERQRQYDRLVLRIDPSAGRLKDGRPDTMLTIDCHTRIIEEIDRLPASQGGRKEG